MSKWNSDASLWVGLWAAVVAVGCGGGECVRHSDCSGRDVCELGSCVVPDAGAPDAAGPTGAPDAPAEIADAGED